MTAMPAPTIPAIRLPDASLSLQYVMTAMPAPQIPVSSDGMRLLSRLQICDDGNACTNDSCDPATGCTAEPVVCDDGNESTEDSCQEGECIYQPIRSESDYGSRGSNQTTDNLSIIQKNSTALAAAISPKHSDRPKCRDQDLR